MLYCFFYPSQFPPTKILSVPFNVQNIKTINYISSIMKFFPVALGMPVLCGALEYRNTILIVPNGTDWESEVK